MYDALHDQLDVGEGFNSLVDWNDSAGRTHADVLALIDKAIAHVAT